jgi:methylated-DNA-[protein]-cysteine S-methyltransferase
LAIHRRTGGASGALTGYAGGVDRKRALLRLEGVRGVDLDVVAPRAQGLQSALAFG